MNSSNFWSQRNDMKGKAKNSFYRNSIKPNCLSKHHLYWTGKASNIKLNYWGRDRPPPYQWLFYSKLPKSPIKFNYVQVLKSESIAWHHLCHRMIKMRENLLDFFWVEIFGWQIRRLEIVAGERRKKVLRVVQVQGALGQSYNHTRSRLGSLTSGMFWDHWMFANKCPFCEAVLMIFSCPTVTITRLCPCSVS